MTTIVTHDLQSTGPAFLISIQEVAPQILEVILPYYLEIDGILTLLNDFDTRDNLTILSVKLDVMSLETVVNVTYFALISPDNQIDGIFIAPTVINYTTIQQEGIGLLVG